MTERLARCGLAALAVAALALAATTDHEVVGSAFVGAAIAFGLGAAFYDRVLEVSTSGVKLAERRQLRAAVDQVAPGAPPERKEKLVEEGAEILTTRRAAGEEVTPKAAITEANQWLQTQALMEKARNETLGNFARWLATQGWEVSKVTPLSYKRPNFHARRDGRLAAIFAPSVWVTPGVVDHFADNAAKFGDSSAQADPTIPVLLLYGPLVGDAEDRAKRLGVSVYLILKKGFRHYLGPDLGASAAS